MTNSLTPGPARGEDFRFPRQEKKWSGLPAGPRRTRAGWKWNQDHPVGPPRRGPPGTRRLGSQEEIGFSFQEEMAQHVDTVIDPARELSRAYRYIRKRHWRIAIIYLDHLDKKYPNWGEIFLAKAIAFYGIHDIERMMDALKTSCHLGNQEACEDLESLIHSKEKDLKPHQN